MILGFSDLIGKLASWNQQMCDERLNIAVVCCRLYHIIMENIAGARKKSLQFSISTAVKTETPYTSYGASACVGSVSPALQPAQNSASNACCLWCDRIFTPRATGGSAQKFCCTGHRQQFWIAARRWTMRAIDAGLLSVDCLKASQTSVHAA